MTIAELDPTWWLAHGLAAMLVFLRVLGVCITAPGFSGPGLDPRFRMGLALILAAPLIPAVAPAIGPIVDAKSTAWGLMAELLTGVLLGGTAALVIAAARQAGEILAIQSGLSTASLYDLDTGDELTPLGQLYGLMAMAVFLAMDGPLVVIGSLVESYRIIPAGGMDAGPAVTTRVFEQVGQALAISLQAAAPAAVALAITGLVLGWLARLAPAIPFTTLSLPIRAFLGIVLIMLSLVSLRGTLEQVWLQWPRWG